MSKDLSAIVEDVLRKIPQTRDCNNKLIYCVLRSCGVESNESFTSVINKLINGELPALESITRARRKLVEQHPELDANAKVKELRAKQEEMYKGYARGTNGII